MQARVQPIHASVPGRVRFTVAGLYHAPELKSKIERRLVGEPGIHHASASELTGHVLVLFDVACDPQVITRAVERAVEDSGDPEAAERIGDSRSRERRLLVKSTQVRALRRMVQHAASPPEGDWHLQDATDTLAAFGSNRDTGLAVEQARALLQKYGPNVLPESVPRSSLSIFVHQFNSMPVWLLGASALISASTAGLADAVVILAVVLVNAGIGFFTERQSERTIRALTRTVQEDAHVLRDARVRQVRAEELVPGDLLLLAPGRYVPADARLVEVSQLSVDESALTGESMPVLKSVPALTDRRKALAERANMVYMGTLATGGSGLAVITATGRHTEMGAIQSLVGETRAPQTPMQRQLDSMGNLLVLLCCSVCGGMFAIGLMRGYPFLQMMRAAISLAVAAVPEGLPTVATTTLALGIAEMRRRRVLIRRLDAVETLGSVQVICLDKTGTLTRNRMFVVAALAGGLSLHVEGGRFLSQDKAIDPPAKGELLRLLQVAALCNECEVSGSAVACVVQGTPTESALVELALGNGLDVPEIRRQHPRVHVQYRAENRLYMGTLHAAPGGKRLIAIKGSPLEVIAMCGWQMRNGRRYKLGEDQREAIMLENERMAGRALRVLGFAYAFTEADSLDAPADLVFLGLVGMADPLRDGMGRLVGAFHCAGIETLMITGDQSATAQAVGRELNLAGDRPLEILDTSHLDQIAPEVLTSLVQQTKVFARVTPAQKLQIVQALQRAGKVVAMTGDGINDGPALKTANVGVAMGSAGTDVARAVADVVLEDDDLQTMLVAVSQGRTIYGNIRKSIHYLLSTNLSEIGVMLSSIAAGLGQPLSPMQLLWINLITDVFPALALAVEQPEPDVLNRPPRDPAEAIVTPGELRRIGFEAGAMTAGTLGAYGLALARHGPPGPSASTVAFMTLTLAQILHVLSCRSSRYSVFSAHKLPPNRYIGLAAGGSVLAQLSSFAVPGLRGLLGLGPIGWVDVAAIGAGAIVPFMLSEATKSGAQP